MFCFYKGWNLTLILLFSFISGVFYFQCWLIQSFPFISCRKRKHYHISICFGLIRVIDSIVSLNKYSFRLKKMKKMNYQGNLNVSFHQPCLEQFKTIMSSRQIISMNVGLTLMSGCQHSSINLQIIAKILKLLMSTNFIKCCNRW